MNNDPWDMDPHPAGPAWDWARQLKALEYNPEKVQAFMASIDDLLADTGDRDVEIDARLALAEGLIELIAAAGWPEHTKKGFTAEHSPNAPKTLYGYAVDQACIALGVESNTVEVHKALSGALGIPNDRRLRNAVRNYLKAPVRLPEPPPYEPPDWVREMLLEDPEDPAT